MFLSENTSRRLYCKEDYEWSASFILIFLIVVKNSNKICFSSFKYFFLVKKTQNVHVYFWYFFHIGN